jgi:hypothetical protein
MPGSSWTTVQSRNTEREIPTALVFGVPAIGWGRNNAARTTEWDKPMEKRA